MLRARFWGVVWRVDEKSGVVGSLLEEEEEYWFVEEEDAAGKGVE